MGARINCIVPIGIGREIEPWLQHNRSRGLSDDELHFKSLVLQRLAAELLRARSLTRLRDARAADLEAWLAGGLPPTFDASTRSKHILVVKCYYKWLEKTGQIFENPAKGLVVPSDRRRLLTAPSAKQIVHVLRSISGDDPVSLRDRALMEMAYGTGARRSELRRMDLGALDMEQGTVRVLGKGTKERVLPMTQAALEALRRYLALGRPALLEDRPDTLALWLSGRTGRRMDLNWFSETVVRRTAAAGVPFTLHALRRACATHLLQGGASVTEVKMILGHAGYSRLNHYLRCAAVDLRAAHRRSRLSR